METNVQKKNTRRTGIWIALALFLLAILAVLLYNPRYAYYYIRWGAPTSRTHLSMVREAREYLATEPEYRSAYYAGGYPPDTEGVCTDVIWRAFRAEGIDFKALVDADIQAALSEYPAVNNWPDSNIDFRRVANLTVYFSRHASELSIDTEDVTIWQPGDIVIYDGHIALVSDKRNAQGLPYILHHAGYGPLEEDALTSRPILHHFRLEDI